MNDGSGRFSWAALALALLIVSCRTAGLQRQDQFVWAIAYADSTSPPIVRVRLTRAQDGVDHIQCLTSESLIYAIMEDKRLRGIEGGWNRAVSIALASRDHSFQFVRSEAWKVVNEAVRYTGSQLRKGCGLIEQGKSALWSDMDGQAVEGPRFPLTSKQK